MADGEEIKIRLTMEELENKLREYNVIRIHKGYLVNLEYVEEIRNNDIRVGEDWLQVSRSKKKAFLDALNNYINGMSK